MAPMTHEYFRRIADENYPESNSHKALNAAAEQAAELAKLHDPVGAFPDPPQYWYDEGDEVGWVAVPDYVRLHKFARRLSAQLAEARKDADRWLWAADILSGDDTPIANAKTLAVAAGLMRNEPLNVVVDSEIAALKGSQQQ